MQALILGAAVAAWAALHSWLASARVKAGAKRIFGAGAFRLYRLFYNSLSVISLLPIGVLVLRLPDQQLYAVPSPFSWFLVGVQAAAVILTVLAVLQTGALHFAGLSQLLEERPSGALVTDGFYGWVRHPLYLFGLIVLWFSPNMSANQLVLSLALSVYLFIGARLEEVRLSGEFGEAYEDYKRRTPMIIPGTASRGGG